MGWIVHYVFEIFIVKAKRVYQRSAMVAQWQESPVEEFNLVKTI